MSENIGAQILRVATAYRDDDNTKANAKAQSEWKKLTRLDRAWIATLLLSAAARDINQNQVADVGGFARSAFSKARTEADLLNEMLALVPGLADSLLGEAKGRRSVADLEEEIRDRNAQVADQKQVIDNGSRQVETAGDFAREMYQQSRITHETILKEREKKVRSIDERPKAKLTVVKDDCIKDDNRHSLEGTEDE